MIMPIKLNRSYWPTIITDHLPLSQDDPRVLLDAEVDGDSFSRAVSVFKFGTLFKSTKRLRFPILVEVLKSLEYRSPPTVLDIGASDGITSLHIIKSLDCRKYYITDLNIEVLYSTRNGKVYFFDTDNNCILIVTKLFVIYTEFKDAIFPFNRIAELFYSKSFDARSDLKRIELINPEVKTTEGNIAIERYDMFERWTHDRVDLVIAANILNRRCFSEKQILQALSNMVYALNSQGRLAVLDSREIEKGTVFRVMNRKIEVEMDINGGTEVRELVLHTCFE